MLIMRTKRLFLVLVLCGLFVPSIAAAYIEPGMVVILWQMLIASLMGIMIFIRRIRLFLFSLIQWFRNILSRDNSNDKINKDGSPEELS